MPVQIHHGSILDLEVDAIVNPANSFLRHGGGLARIIDQAATRPFDVTDYRNASIEALKANRRVVDEQIARWQNDHLSAPLIATGNARATSAGRLSCLAVIHAVGPVWNGGHYHERELLRSAHLEACAAAYDLGCQSVAFPAISCGVFGMPVDIAAPIAIKAVKEVWADKQPNGIGMDITFALTDDEHVDAFAAAMLDLCPVNS